jgi:PPK2 family polyphosphate:nucleotide phosphotransferase
MFDLKKCPTKAPDNLVKSKVLEDLKVIQSRLFRIQKLLYANNKHSLLIILQGLDASGKDSTIRHVFSCVNPMGCNVKSFKKPTEEEKKHSFLWRIHKHLPAKGMIQIFNRSHYEDILVPTVHRTLDTKLIDGRYDYINTFENHLQRNNTLFLKFFLHISHEAQEEKLSRRLTDPSKKWKYDIADDKEKKNRKAYLEVYHKIFERCSPEIPWEIIPADQKWYRNYLIAKSVVKKLEGLNMSFPS